MDFPILFCTPNNPSLPAGAQELAYKSNAASLDERVIAINGRMVELGGDVILKIDNQTVSKLDDILTYLEREKK